MPLAKLAPAAAQGFADLLPLLSCGEESAALAFDGLSHTGGQALRSALAGIAEEERHHEAMLAGIRASLPPPRDLTSARRRARQFYVRLQERDPVRHLARIAALDAGLCVVLAALTRPGRGVAADPAIVSRLRAIHRDEVKHVRLATALTASLGRAGNAIKAETRIALATLLAPYAASFEQLAIDPDRLLEKLRSLPGALRS